MGSQNVARGKVTPPSAACRHRFVNIDGTAGGDRPAHTVLLKAGVPVVEHLTGLARLPTTGATFPVRAFACLP